MKTAKKPIILFRKSRENADEFCVAQKYFDVTETRMEIENRTVIGRYSVLPFLNELERDLKIVGSNLINSSFEHSYISGFDYYHDLKHLTAKTWFELSSLPKDGGPFIVKGKTNSRKFDWDTMMFAKDFKRAGEISSLLFKDPLISPQGLIYREFLNLKVLEYGISGTPFSNEWRFFFYKDKLLSYGFYWSIAEQRGEMSDIGISLAREAASIIKEHVNFFVIDVAEDINGKWWVIEVNDGQQSGLSENDPDILYSNLKKAIESE